LHCPLRRRRRTDGSLVFWYYEFAVPLSNAFQILSKKEWIKA
jgi:hypothetical protein